jgi:hypothetical protein
MTDRQRLWLVVGALLLIFGLIAARSQEPPRAPGAPRVPSAPPAGKGPSGAPSEGESIRYFQ